MRSIPSDDLARAELDCPLPKHVFSFPSFPKISNEWGYTGSRYQGPNRAFSGEDAESYQGPVACSGELPLLMEDGFDVSPLDKPGHVLVTPQRGPPRIVEYRRGRLATPEVQAKRLLPNLIRCGKVWMSKSTQRVLGFTFLRWRSF